MQRAQYGLASEITRKRLRWSIEVLAGGSDPVRHIAQFIPVASGNPEMGAYRTLWHF
jgi:hypothetical protein